MWNFRDSPNLSLIAAFSSFWNRHTLGKIEDVLSRTQHEITLLEGREAEVGLTDSDSVHLSCLHRKNAFLRRQINLKWWSQAIQMDQ